MLSAAAHCSGGLGACRDWRSAGRGSLAPAPLLRSAQHADLGPQPSEAFDAAARAGTAFPAFGPIDASALAALRRVSALVWLSASIKAGTAGSPIRPSAFAARDELSSALSFKASFSASTAGFAAGPMLWS